MALTPFQLERQTEALCQQIKSTNAEFWEVRNKAVLGLLALISQYDHAPAATVHESFSPTFFRLLKEPLKDMISDLRSQQVRDVCQFLVKLTEIAKDNAHLKAMLREVFTFILDGIKVPNRVMSGFVDNAIIAMIKHTTFKTCLPSLIAEIKTSKAKLVREHCLEYLNEILIHWDVNEKDAEMIAEAIRVGLEDPAVRAREVARMAYLNMHLLFPKKTEKIKNSVSVPLQQRLLKAEQEHIPPLLKKVMVQGGANNGAAPPPTAEKAVPPPAPPAHLPHPGKSDDRVARSSASRSPPRAPTHDDVSSIGGACSVASSGAQPPAPRVSPVKIANLRARRQSYEEAAVQSIQAVIRGNLCRRNSVRKSILAVHAGMNTNTHTYGPVGRSPVGGRSPSGGSPQMRTSPSRIPRSPPRSPSTLPPTTPGVVSTLAPFAPRPGFNRGGPSPMLAPPGSFGHASHAQMPSPQGSAHTTSATQSTASPSGFSSSSNSSSSGGGRVKQRLKAPLPVGSSLLSSPRLPTAPSPTADGALPSPTALPSDSTYPTDLHVGDLVLFKGKDVETKGVVRFIGVTAFASGYWVGVELTTGVGKNDGSVLGQRYFTCAPQSGLFVRACQVEPEPVVVAASEAGGGSSSSRRSSSGSRSRDAPPAPPPPLPPSEQVFGLLKIKVASAMERLHRQLDMIENLESVGAAARFTMNHVDIIIQLQACVEEELEINRQFSTKLEALL